MEYREPHPWNVSVGEAAKIQLELRERVSLADDFGEIRSVAGVDVGLPAGSNEGCAVVAILSFPDLQLIESHIASRTLEFPYIPGFLSFRETPAVLSAFEKVENVPDVIVVDGQGVAHPRGMGIAAHLGVLLDMPTIGCAKSPLYGSYDEPGTERGSATPILDPRGNRIGSVVRTRTGAKPVFVSPGHMVSFESAVKIVLDCTRGYRLPEPTRLAHRLASQYGKH